MNIKPINTERLTLKPFTLEDTPKLYKMSLETGMKEWIPDQVYQSEEEAHSVLEFLTQQYASGQPPTKVPIVLGVYLKDGELIGHVGLSPYNDGVEIGYAIEDSQQGKGYASEAVKAMTKWGIAQFNLDFIYGIVATKNIASCKVLERAGYTIIKEAPGKMHGKDTMVRTCKFEAKQLAN